MTQRLRRPDLALLAVESSTTPLHNAMVEIFDPTGSDFDHDALVALVADRIAFVPRYRQRLQAVPAMLANPTWVDDPDFDLSYHVRRSALPRPGSREQLLDLVARIVSRPLDQQRPLWEIYLVEGLAGGRVALLSKSHQILVDGVETVDLNQVLLDVSPVLKRLGADGWEPRPRPSALELVADAVRDNVTDPATALTSLRSATETVVRRLPVRLPFARRPAPEWPLEAGPSAQRLLTTVRTPLASYRTIRDAHGGTVNDVILATLTGALRSWLMGRDGSLGGRRSLRAMVPMSVIDHDLEPTSLGTAIAGHVVDLPIGEASPLVRLHQVTYAFRSHSETGRAVAANRLAGIAGFAPSTFHALGARVAFSQLWRGFHVVITNVPGPQFPLYAAGAIMEETYPFLPLLPGQGLAIGVTSYDGHVHLGVTADRAAFPDIELFGPCVSEALDELMDSADGSRPRAPRGRRKGRA